MVIVYSTPSCPYCSMAKDFLRSKNVPFEDIDVSRNQQAAMEMIRKSGQNGVPVIDFNGEIIIGFDRGRLERLTR
ncbi:MAG: NrdH-redoxin [Spirochaetales bacterium]|jgi:glutaredoxin-like YruB-family protein|nr:glutathione S-transferase N-terminal domain-containing protein [Exilispira sp.]NMC67065.1 NrdH-redoxin [Spirochaetales bacterium]